MNSKDQKELSFNIGIVGGGNACVYFLNLLESSDFPHLDLKILGVCDINPQAPGMIKAREL